MRIDDAGQRNDDSAEAPRDVEGPRTDPTAEREVALKYQVDFEKVFASAMPTTTAIEDALKYQVNFEKVFASAMPTTTAIEDALKYTVDIQGMLVASMSISTRIDEAIAQLLRSEQLLASLTITPRLLDGMFRQALDIETMLADSLATSEVIERVIPSLEELHSQILLDVASTVDDEAQTIETTSATTLSTQQTVRYAIAFEVSTLLIFFWLQEHTRTATIDFAAVGGLIWLIWAWASSQPDDGT